MATARQHYYQPQEDVPAIAQDLELTIRRMSRANGRCHDFLKVPFETRKAAFTKVLADVKQGTLSTDCLLPFIRFEENPRLVAKAVHEYVSLYPCDMLDELLPVRALCSIVTDPQTTNQGAVLGGLVMMGDHRINAIVRTLRDQMTPGEIRSFARIQGIVIKAETVYFYLDWLSALPDSTPKSVFSDLCCGLMLMVVHDEYRLVEEAIDDTVGFRYDEQCHRRVPFATFLNRVLPAFKSLVTRPEYEYDMNQVITIWKRHQEIRY